MRFESITIEQNSRGATYRIEDGSYTIYGHSTYEKWSVLAGQNCRQYLKGGMADEAEARAWVAEHHPGVEVSVSGSTYAPPFLPAQPPEWFDPSIAGETW